jgi:hypothetical protein
MIYKHDYPQPVIVITLYDVTISVNIYLLDMDRDMGLDSATTGSLSSIT